jgi:hypothetical protein
MKTNDNDLKIIFNELDIRANNYFKAITRDIPKGWFSNERINFIPRDVKINKQVKNEVQ